MCCALHFALSAFPELQIEKTGGLNHLLCVTRSESKSNVN